MDVIKQNEEQNEYRKQKYAGLFSGIDIKYSQSALAAMRGDRTARISFDNFFEVRRDFFQMITNDIYQGGIGIGVSNKDPAVIRSIKLTQNGVNVLCNDFFHTAHKFLSNGNEAVL